MINSPGIRNGFSLVSLLCALGILAFQHIENGQQDHLIEMQPVVHVVELFTSQGCSSCPPADQLLQEISNDDNVIALSYHVDYWNRLGWKDQFSEKQYSIYQRKYAQQLGSGVYTPQMVVNGKNEFVGSNKKELHKNLNKKSRVTQLTAPKVTRANDVLAARIDFSNVPKNSTIHVLAVLENHLTKVTRGENARRTLVNQNIVIDRKEISKEDSEIQFDLPQDTNDRYCVALIVQDNNLNILGASMSDYY